MPRIVDLGVTKYVWVPGDTGITDVSAPSAAAINGGKDISKYVVTSTTVGPTASETVSERAVTDTANVVTLTVANYEGSLTLFRDYLNGTPTADDLLATFTGGVIGFLCRRIGKDAATAAAAGEKWEVYKFRADTPQVQSGAGDGYLKMVVPLHQQGRFDISATVVA